MKNKRKLPLRGIDKTYSDFEFHDLPKRSSFNNCTFNNCIFTGDLTWVSFMKCNFENIIFAEGRLSNVNFVDTGTVVDFQLDDIRLTKTEFPFEVTCLDKMSAKVLRMQSRSKGNSYKVHESAKSVDVKIVDASLVSAILSEFEHS